ncbi:MAG: hypothetical protein JW751_29885 [Polyangiaceae bacterium]|nr:hypothetical protein [Polyangiaceae bacterium]
MRKSSLVVSMGLGALGGLAAPAASAEVGPVRVLVLRESAGSTSAAQPHVDRLIGVVAKLNGWSGASGKYENRRDAAEAYVAAEHPRYGILSLGAYLGLRSKYGLDVIGQVDVARAGGLRYSLISKTQTSLEGCRSKRLASDHAGDARFVDQVASGKQFRLADFTLVPTRRPIQTIKALAEGTADCALIDDAQLADLGSIQGVEGIRPVWTGPTLPPMPVVAFSGAPAAEKEAFRASLGRICQGEGASACKEVGMRALKTATTADYAAVQSAYDR